MQTKPVYASSAPNKAADAPGAFVSVIIPLRNEEKYIVKCLDSIIGQSFPKEDLEILLIDGRSEDATRRIIGSYSKRYTYFKMLDNPSRITPSALNIGIKAAKGDIIIRLDAHAYYDNDYILKCVETLNCVDAANVGGPIVTLPGDDTLRAEAIALATSHRFGVGNSKFRTTTSPGYVDTVPFGAFRKEVFESVGLFNEKLPRNQDIELNSRIRKRGLKIFLTPDIKSFYYNRSTLKELWRQNFTNGKWNIFTHAISENSLSVRHFVPLLFVSGLFASLVLTMIFPLGIWVSGPFIGSYTAANIYFSIKAGLTRHKFSLVPLLFITFLTLHLSYGFGSLYGLIRVKGWKKVLE